MNKAPHPVEILLHPFWVNQQLVDHAGEPREREIKRDRCVRPDEALDRRVRDIALVPQCDILQCGQGIAADHAGLTGEVFGQDRVALVRHRA